MTKFGGAMPTGTTPVPPRSRGQCHIWRLSCAAGGIPWPTPPLRAQKRFKREKMVSVVSRRHQLLSAEVPSRDASSFLLVPIARRPGNR